jgi:group I intron endonuclease
MAASSLAASGIYAIRNTVNGKVYIGSASNIKKRWRDHQRMLGAGTHHSRKLQRAWAKYGSAAFEFVVLLNCACDALVHYEQHLIDESGCFRHGYNMSPTAGSTLGTKFSDEVRAKFAALRTGRTLTPEHRANIGKAGLGNKGRTGQPLSEETKAKLRGRTHTPEARAKISAAHTGRKWPDRKPHSEETRAKMSAALKGVPKSTEHAAKVGAAQKGRKFTDEHRRKLSEAHKKRPHDPERVAKMAEANRGRKLTPEQIAKRHATRLANKALTGKY